MMIKWHMIQKSCNKTGFQSATSLYTFSLTVTESSMKLQFHKD